MLLKKAESTLDLVKTGRRSQKEVLTLLDKMREEDEHWKVGQTGTREAQLFTEPELLAH